MVKKSHKNSKNLVDLIESATVPAIRHLVQIDKFSALGDVDAALPEGHARAALREHILELKPEDITIADQEAVRLLQLVQFRTEEMLEHAYRELECEQHAEIATFDRSADAMTRLIWLRVNAPRIFDQLETIYLTHHFHGHKKFLGFTVRDGDGRDFEWTPAVEKKLRESVGEILELDDDARQNCELIHFEMDEGDADVLRRIHYLVVYHPGKMKLLRQMKDRRRDLLVFTPALEATLVYDPAVNKVHVLSSKRSTAQRLADRFVAVGFDKPLSKQPVGAISYNLGMFKHAVDLQAARARGAVILGAWISSLTVTLGHSRHTVTVSMGGSDSIWSVSESYFGNHNPLSSCRSVVEVKLSFLVRFDGERDSRALDITVDQSGSCNLLTLPDRRLRQCGEDILTSLSVMRRVEPISAGAGTDLFNAEMKLLDLTGREADGHLLNALGLTAADLVGKGLLKQRSPGEYITIPIEDGDGREGFRQLKVSFNSTSTFAIDDVSGIRYDLKESDLCRYDINKGYLRERLDELLRPHLVDMPLTVDEEEPYVLGNYRMGEQRIPVVLVSRLWDAKHADKLDTKLRQSNLGLTIVLSTTEGLPRRYLGPGIVVPLNVLAKTVNAKVSIDLVPVEAEIRRRQSEASVIDTPHLIKDDARSGTLHGPWPDPWTLTKKEWLNVVEVFVNGWTSGRRKWSKAQIEAAAGVSFRTMAELFRGAPEWQTYLRGADGNAKPRVWELNIGTPDYLGSAQATGDESAESEVA